MYGEQDTSEFDAMTASTGAGAHPGFAAEMGDAWPGGASNSDILNRVQQYQTGKLGGAVPSGSTLGAALAATGLGGPATAASTAGTISTAMARARNARFAEGAMVARSIFHPRTPAPDHTGLSAQLLRMSGPNAALPRITP